MAIKQEQRVDIVDALGASPRRSVTANPIDFGCVGSMVWLVENEHLQPFSLENAAKLGEGITLGGKGRLIVSGGTSGNTAVWRTADTTTLLHFSQNKLEATDISDEVGDAHFVLPVAGQRLIVCNDTRLRVYDVGRGDVATGTPPPDSRVTNGSGLFGGRALAIIAQTERAAAVIVLRTNGSLIHNVSVPVVRKSAIAEARGIALLYTQSQKLLAVDMRYGKILGESEPPMAVRDLSIDADGKFLVIAGEPVDGHLPVLHVPYTDLFGGGGNLAVGRDGRPLPNTVRESIIEPAVSDADTRPQTADDPIRADPPDEPLPPPPEIEHEPDGEPIVVPDVPLRGLGRMPPPLQVSAPAHTDPYRDPREHLDELLDVVSARTARAIADAWDSGRLSLPAHDTRPFEREVRALVGLRAGGAPEELAQADQRLTELAAIVGRRAQASLATGDQLPFVEVAREFNLTTVAAQVLLVVAAPSLRGEIARLYGVLANDENRPICDRHLVQTILAGDHKPTRHAVAQELTLRSSLVRFGLVKVAPTPDDQYLFAPLAVDPVLLARLRSDLASRAGPGAVTFVRHGDRPLEELAVPLEIKRELVLALAQPIKDGDPARVVVRGRRGSGRTTLLAALAARAERDVAVIDAQRMPRAGQALAERLRAELRRADLRGAVPVVSGIESLDASDAEGVEHVREVFRSHPGPVTMRTTPEFNPPMDPGYVSVVLPPLSETERSDFWIAALSRNDLQASGVEHLAGRFRIGPGTIETIIASTIARRAADPDAKPDATNDLDATARQHIETRLGSVASRVSKLARWEQVALPDDVMDSIREFLGRIKHRRTVYESWGFDRNMTTARGLTALFHGPPGTGKTMVAGLIARELGLDLYRVDLARITSKWIGETEKNLGEVFDAAEDGQAVILFDEADSLFAKRTEVKSSVDRYANLEVNYLLQRLDSFDGVAILTTNLEGSIDQAFKRRLSLRLAFPFPDEDMRVRLWAAHVPAEVPTVGDFDFNDLAKRFPMSGGYIRNSALRAAFLAAQEDQALSQEHLERAIHLEYREMGKLAAGGRME